MFRPNGAIVFESNGVAVTFDGDLDRMELTVSIKQRDASVLSRYVMDSRDVDELYQFLWGLKRREEASKRGSSSEDDRLKGFMEKGRR